MFDEAAALDARGGAVGREYVRHPGPLEVICRDGPGEIAARVQMRDVERSGVALQKGVEAERQEGLMVVREPVRHVWKDPQVHAVAGSRGRPRAKERGTRASLWQAGRGVADVRRAEGDVMAAACESARQGAGKPRDAAIGQASPNRERRGGFAAKALRRLRTVRRQLDTLSRYGNGRAVQGRAGRPEAADGLKVGCCSADE